MKIESVTECERYSLAAANCRPRWFLAIFACADARDARELSLTFGNVGGRPASLRQSADAAVDEVSFQTSHEHELSKDILKTF